MDKEEAIEMLKQALTEIPRLKQLHYDDAEFELWRDKVRDIVVVGLHREDLKRFSPGSFKIRGMFADHVYQSEYVEEHLPALETGLKSIIQKYELMGVENGPSNEHAMTPSELLSSLQLHTRIIDVSKSLFESGHYASAIFEAFKAVNNAVKEKSGLDMDGKQLMARAFDERQPEIILNDLKTQSEKDEQEGFKFLFMGAMQGIRNPKAHDLVQQDDPYLTLEYMTFASLLMRKISFWTVP